MAKDGASKQYNLGIQQFPLWQPFLGFFTETCSSNKSQAGPQRRCIHTKTSYISLLHVMQAERQIQPPEREKADKQGMGKKEKTRLEENGRVERSERREEEQKGGKEKGRKRRREERE